MNGLSILGTGRCVPNQIMTNEDWSQLVDTNDEWIVSRTGIRERHFVTGGETNLKLAMKAAQRAIDQSGISPNQIGLCIVATFTPDCIMPSVSSLLQGLLGLSPSTPCFDLNAACSGFVYALKMAQAYLSSSDASYALVIGSEVISKILDRTDRSTCVLFGDGAGALLVEKKRSPFYALLGTMSNEEALFCPSAYELDKLQMNGKEVFRFAVDMVPKAIKKISEEAQIELENVDFIVCHQANERIIKSIAHRLKLPTEKFYINIERYGNTSAASIPIALDEMNQQGLLKNGTRLICVGFGGGFTWGSVYLQV